MLSTIPAILYLLCAIILLNNAPVHADLVSVDKSQKGSQNKPPARPQSGSSSASQSFSLSESASAEFPLFVDVAKLPPCRTTASDSSRRWFLPFPSFSSSFGGGFQSQFYPPQNVMTSSSSSSSFGSGTGSGSNWFGGAGSLFGGLSSIFGGAIGGGRRPDSQQSRKPPQPSNGNHFPRPPSEGSQGGSSGFNRPPPPPQNGGQGSSAFNGVSQNGGRHNNFLIDQPDNLCRPQNLDNLPICPTFSSSSFTPEKSLVLTRGRFRDLPMMGKGKTLITSDADNADESISIGSSGADEESGLESSSSSGSASGSGSSQSEGASALPGTGGSQAGLQVAAGLGGLGGGVSNNAIEENNEDIDYRAPLPVQVPPQSKPSPAGGQQGSAPNRRPPPQNNGGKHRIKVVLCKSVASVPSAALESSQDRIAKFDLPMMINKKNRARF